MIAVSPLRRGDPHRRLPCARVRYEEGLADAAERQGTAEADAFARQIRRRRALSDGNHEDGFTLLALRPA